MFPPQCQLVGALLIGGTMCNETNVVQESTNLLKVHLHFLKMTLIKHTQMSHSRHILMSRKLTVFRTPVIPE